MPDGIYQTKTSAAPYPFPGVGPPNFVDPLVPVGINGLERPPGFFSAFEIGLIHPTINGELVGTAPVSGVNVPVILAPANLDWTGAPRFTLGYHFASNAGSAVADYRLFASEGTKDFATFGNFGAAFQTTRLDWQSIDLGYNTPDLAPQPLLDVRADLNLRIGAIYYDHFLRNSSFQQKARNQFVGVGPVAAINATHRLGFLPQLALYGQIEGGVLIGGIEQSFEEIRSVGPNQFVGGARDISETGAVPVFGVEAGLSFIPKRGSDWFRFTFGYVYEQWFGTGNAGLSSGDVYFQGLFFRGEFNY
ncbi:MAG: Lpg1974 family pore-forming outer membrane protein [Gemmataceae bacterium]